MECLIGRCSLFDSVFYLSPFRRAAIKVKQKSIAKEIPRKSSVRALLRAICALAPLQYKL